MEDTVTVEEAIKTAIDFETRVRDTYIEAMKHAVDQVGKRVFKLLASEEQEHLDYLGARLDEWQRTGKITVESLATSIPSEKIIRDEVSKLKTHVGEPVRGSELKQLQKAREVEIETSNFYKKMVEELSDEGQVMFARFVEIEEGHLALVQAEIDAVSGLGFWFDIAEFDLEAG
jgi:rubrerythrin